jgi:hypothetical protein
MSNGLVKLFSLISVVAIGAAANAQISFQSGNGTVGGHDSRITVLEGPSTADFSTLTGADFNDAKHGKHAVILPSLASGWVSRLGGGSTAEWVGLSSTAGNNSYASDTALYAISFDVQHKISDAVLDLTFSVDDQLGGSNNEGLFIDGHAIANSNSPVLWDGQIASDSYNLGTLNRGEHTLYLDVVNSGGGPSGVIFQGQIQSACQSVPEPAPIAILGVGALGFIRRRRASKG